MSEVWREFADKYADGSAFREYAAKTKRQRDELLAACKQMLKAYAPNRDESDRVHLHSAVIAAIDAVARAERNQ
jgi:hypothetical protein